MLAKLAYKVSSREEKWRGREGGGRKVRARTSGLDGMRAEGGIRDGAEDFQGGEKNLEDLPTRSSWTSGTKKRQ